MCGRTSLFLPQPEIERRFGAEFVSDWQPRYNITPQQDIATIRNESPEQIDQLRWGLLPSWVDDPNDWPSPINARGESVADKPAFRSAFKSRRCLVIADGFYEWKGDRPPKQPYRIERIDREPFAFAGLWERWTSNGSTLETVTIITTEANPAVRPIHERMPVMLEPEEEDRWLADEDSETLQALLDPFPAELTTTYPISTAVNDPSNDTSDIIEPIHIGTQTGLDEFG